MSETNIQSKVILVNSYGDANIYTATIENALLLLQCYAQYGDYSEESDPKIYASKKVSEIVSFVSRYVTWSGSDVSVQLVSVRDTFV